ncbi:MAG: 4Fe-4S binding protein [bacterium]
MAYKITDECVSCGTCVDECPNNAIIEENDIYIIKQELCKENKGEKCGKCKDICPVEAVIEE